MKKLNKKGMDMTFIMIIVTIALIVIGLVLLSTNRDIMMGLLGVK